MPSRPKKMCAHGACSTLALPGDRFCERHTRGNNEQTRNRRAYDRDRYQNNPFRKEYLGARWQALRDRVRRQQPLCAHCGNQPGEVCDHIIQAAKYVEDHGGDMERFYDIGNLQMLCRTCHNQKTAGEWR